MGARTQDALHALECSWPHFIFVSSLCLGEPSYLILSYNQCPKLDVSPRYRNAVFSESVLHTDLSYDIYAVELPDPLLVDQGSYLDLVPAYFLHYGL
eukprot:scaffold283180_cov17-Prasinocladus_malaysianus.AAC.1